MESKICKSWTVARRLRKKHLLDSSISLPSLPKSLQSNQNVNSWTVYCLPTIQHLICNTEKKIGQGLEHVRTNLRFFGLSFNTELCTYYVLCQPLGKSYISMKNPPVQTIYVHVHHSNFQIVLENYTMEKKICLLAILCACMAQFSTNKNRQFFLFLRNGRYQTRQLMRFDHIFWSENRDIWWWVKLCLISPWG